MKIISKYILFIIIFGIEIYYVVTTYLSQFRRSFADYFFGDLFKFVLIFIFIILLIWDISEFKKNKKIFSIPTILSVFTIIIGFFVSKNLDQKFISKLKSPDLLVVHNRGAFGNSEFSFKTDGTYIFYQNTGKMEGKYSYGKYKINNDTIFLNRKEEVWDNSFSDKLFISNIYHGERAVLLFFDGKKGKGFYFVGEDNRKIK